MTSAAQQPKIVASAIRGAIRCHEAGASGSAIFGISGTRRSATAPSDRPASVTSVANNAVLRRRFSSGIRALDHGYDAVSRVAAQVSDLVRAG